MLKVTDKRVHAISEIISGLKTIKFFAWEKSFSKQVLNLRSKEVWLNILLIIFKTCLHCLFLATPALVSTVMLFLYSFFIAPSGQIKPDVIFPGIFFP